MKRRRLSELTHLESQISRHFAISEELERKRGFAQEPPAGWNPFGPITCESVPYLAYYHAMKGSRYAAMGDFYRSKEACDD